MEGRRAKLWIIRGSVQGVGFRFFAQREAAAIGLTGWARNLDDGSVEVYAAGSEKQLSEFAGALHRGPRMADVRGVEEFKADDQELSSFSIR